MRKGDILVSGKNTYRIAGVWCKDLVLENTDEDSDEILVYTPSELTTLIREGKFIPKAELDKGIQRTHFSRKASSIDELRGRTGSEFDKQRFVIEKEIVLSKEEFEEFSKNLLSDFDFIGEHSKLMYVDTDKIWHCILVTGAGSDVSILIQNEGYLYARYCSIYTKK
jgi:hypothetical protein